MLPPETLQNFVYYAVFLHKCRKWWKAVSVCFCVKLIILDFSFQNHTVWTLQAASAQSKVLCGPV